MKFSHKICEGLLPHERAEVLGVGVASSSCAIEMLQVETAQRNARLSLYRLVPAKLHRGSVLDAQPDEIEPAKIVPEGGQLQSYRPFVKSENLFELFVRRAKSEEGVLEFVTNFGPLTHDGLRKGGEVVQGIIDEAKEMSGVLRGRTTIATPLRIAQRFDHH